MQVLVKFLAVCCGAGVLAGFFGALHPAGDSFAVFRVPLLVLFALAVIWSDWSKPLRWGGAGLAIAGLFPHAVSALRPLPEIKADLTLYQQNLLWSRTENAAWLAEIRNRQPDLLMLQEVSDQNRVMLEALHDLYPWRVDCPLGSKLGEAVFSRLPMVEGSAQCSERDGFAAMQVDTRNGPVWAISMHLYWPWPRGQAAQLDRILPAITAMEGATIVAGDFNAVAWSHSVARVMAATDTETARPGVPTFVLPYVPLPIAIDYVLTGTGLTQSTRRMPRLGSDHRGLWSELAFASP